MGLLFDEGGVGLTMNFESHVQFADWCAPVKISNREEYAVLQALQFQGVNVRRILPGGTG
jgi:hypothetical protein